MTQADSKCHRTFLLSAWRWFRNDCEKYFGSPTWLSGMINLKVVVKKVKVISVYDK